MIFSRRLLPFVTFALLGISAAWAAGSRSKPTRPAMPDDATAFKGAIMLDAATGRILFEDRADVVGPPASMTKLMTFAVLHERLAAGAFKLDSPVKITPEDARMGGTQVYLDPRETFPVEELIFAMMIQSANDAAHALARFAAGSVPAFVELMNAKARALGMTHTTFRTPHGLPPSSRRIQDGDLTTPRDFALLSRHLLQHTDVIKYTSVRLRPFGTGVRKEAVAMKNHNNLLGKVAGVDGLKTGYTAGAGFCLAATAQRDQRRVIAVVMGSAESKVRDLKVAEMLERGFASLPAGDPAALAGSPITPARPAASPSPVAPAARPPASSGSAPEPAAEAGPTIKFSIPRK